MVASLPIAAEYLVREYAAYRGQGLSHPKTVARLSEAVGIPLEQLVRIVVEGDWEDRYNRTRTVVLLKSEEFLPHARLAQALERYKEAGDVLQRFYYEADSEIRLDEDGKPLDANRVQRYRTAQLAYHDARKHLDDVKAEVQRRVLESRTSLHSKQRFQEVAEQLLEAYRDLGPQYHVLVELVADAKVRLEEMRESGRDVEGAEYNELVKLVMGGVNQLQKFTETLKTEHTDKKVHEAVYAVLLRVEHHLVDHPHLWRTIAYDIRNQLEAGEAVTVDGMS